MLPLKYRPTLFALFLSGMMSFIVSGVATVKAVGLPPDILILWMRAWAIAWPVAFVCALGLAPFARKWAEALTREKA